MKKTFIIIFASAVLLLSGYFVYRYFFYTCCALPPKSAVTGPKSNDGVLANPDLLYSSRVTIGFCRTKSGDGGTCYSKTSLYFSGKLVIEGSEVVMGENGEERTAYPTIEKTLDKKAVDEIIRQIRDSGVLTKPCEAELIMDFYVDYFINLDGIQREIKFPGCETELNKIDKLIGAAADK